MSSDADAENRERQEAEFEFVQAAYNPDEAWVVEGDTVNNSTRIHRRLELSVDTSSSIPVELILTLPPTYPSDEAAPLQVDASVVSSSSNNSKNNNNSSSSSNNNNSTASTALHRKLAMDAMPSLLEACRSTALESAGVESVFVVLSRADEWIDHDWAQFLEECTSRVDSLALERAANDASGNRNSNSSMPLVLGRKLIYSHHIIAKSKRRAISDLAKDYQLGGYYKIGWPGIIVIEGEEENCNLFCDEIRTMRWQYLVIRGEERETIANSSNGSSNGNGNGSSDGLDELRRFPPNMTELAEDQMSRLSELCREAGLEDLFKTSMKIYGGNKPGEENGNNENDNDNDNDEDECSSPPPRYGTLIWVDHMNDPKGYTKWIRKTCQSSGCSCAILRYTSTAGGDDAPAGGGSRPLIVVGLHADEASPVKQVLKRWRTSRVDVDARGIPCLERKMDVLMEGELPAAQEPEEPSCQRKDTRNGGGDNSNSNSNSSTVPRDPNCWTVERNDERLTLTEMESLLDSIGGSSWKEAFRDVIRSRNGGSNHKCTTKR